MAGERRTSNRHLVGNRAFVALGGGYTRVGGIRDISSGGIAFEYYFHKHLNYEAVDRLDIFAPRNCFYLANVPCRIVYDETVYETTNPLFIIKRCGLKFKTLKEEQAAQLKVFMDNLTTGVSASEESLKVAEM